MIIIYFAMIIFSSSIGSWVDASPSRLRTLLTTIVCNRGSVIVGSLFWLAILSQRDLLLRELPSSRSDGGDPGRPGDGPTTLPFFMLPTNPALKGVGFALAITCGIVERLSASGNLLSMERDWVPTVAAASASSQSSAASNTTTIRDKNPYDLTHLSAVMRRIDLVCKLFSPIVLSLVISLSGSIRVGVLFTGLTSALCIPVEVLSARSVWRGNKALQEAKPRSAKSTSTTTTTTTTSDPSLYERFLAHLATYPRDFAMYFTTPSSVWIPSLALAMLHFNMLTWRATFITYLLTVGYPLDVITAARTAGSLFEISSTVVTPWLVVVLGRAGRGGGSGGGDRRGNGEEEEEEEAGQGLLAGSRDDVDDDDNGGGGGGGSVVVDRQTLTGLQRVALWGITWQVANTVCLLSHNLQISTTSCGKSLLHFAQICPGYANDVVSFLSAEKIPVVLAIWAITADSKSPTPPSLSPLSPSPSGNSGNSFSTLPPASSTSSKNDTTTTPLFTVSNSILLFTFLSLSRLGVWVCDLATQQLTTTLVPVRHRSSFAGVESSITNVFELAGALASIAFPEPREYPWLASASLGACVLSWALYAGWVRRRRGHLVHLEKVVGEGGCLGKKGGR